MLGLKALNQHTFKGLSTKSRNRKGEILHSLFTLDEHTKILDIGGQLDPAGKQVLDTHPYRHNITVVNIDRQHLDAIAGAYPEVTTVEGDATNLPFESGSFDLVYSNAVIEHLPTLQAQHAMAREIQRVGRAWFITTPNRWYPFEFHTRLPFVSWLPSPLMMRLCKIMSYSHVQQRYRFWIPLEVIRLLSNRQLKRLFPNSLVMPLRITFWPETIIVAGPQGELPEPQARPSEPASLALSDG